MPFARWAFTSGSGRGRPSTRAARASSWRSGSNLFGALRGISPIVMPILARLPRLRDIPPAIAVVVAEN